jgi:osmotically-inducible protein OsmY
MADRYWDRDREERGRRYRGEGYYGGYYETPERERDRERDWRRGDDRGFLDRAGDEVRSWFGDEEAHRRRMRDERDERGRWPEGRGEADRGWGERSWWPGRERGWGEERRGGQEDVDRNWARQWGYAEGRGSGQREADRGWARGWGYSGGYGAGAGYLGGRTDYPGGRSDWSTSGSSGSGGYEPGESIGSSWRGGLSQGPYVGRGPRGYRRSDERIREDICEQMSQCGDLDATEIDIVVVSGEVTLQGMVPDRHAKRLAEDLTEQVSGVREVNNQIRVTQGGGQQDQQNRPFRAA